MAELSTSDRLLAATERILVKRGVTGLSVRKVARMFEGMIDSVEQIAVSSSDLAEPGNWADRKVAITVYP